MKAGRVVHHPSTDRKGHAEDEPKRGCPLCIARGAEPPAADACEVGYTTLTRDRAEALTSYQAQAEFRKAVEARALEMLTALRAIAERTPHIGFACSTRDYFEEGCPRCIALRAVKGL